MLQRSNLACVPIAVRKASARGDRNSNRPHRTSQSPILKYNRFYTDNPDKYSRGTRSTEVANEIKFRHVLSMLARGV